MRTSDIRSLPRPLRRPARRRDDHRETPPPSRTLVDVFAATAARHAGRLALDAADGALTYAELTDRADAVAQRLGALGVGPGDRIGVRIPSGSADLHVAILGVLRSGAAYVPVDHDDPDERAARVWAGAGVCAVLGPRLELELLGAPRADDRRPPRPDEDAWIIFTSGSTGEPKGVAITHRAAAAFVDAETQLWAVTPDDRVLAAFSVSFDASCEEMWLAWRNGATLVPAPRALVRAGSELEPWLAQQAITVISTVPTLAALWSEAALSQVRLLILGGEACPDALGWRLAAGREVWNTYGPTEAAVVSTAARITPGEPVGIGRPLRGWELAVIDPDGHPVSPGEAGELVIGGIGLGRYLDADLDAARFAPLPGLPWTRAYRTGDIVRSGTHGLAFVGRRDDQVKLGGRRLELGEVDAHLESLPGVRAGRAAVRETATGNRVLVAYVVGEVTPDEVRGHLTARLPAGIAPIIVMLDDLPRGATGKADRAALPWPPPPAGPQAAPPAGSPVMAWLADRWADQLGPLAIGPDSDFFALGGSSLAAAKLISCLRERFPAVAVADLYEHRTLAALSARLESLGEVGAPREVSARRGHRRWGSVQVLGVIVLLALTAAQTLLGLLAYDNVTGGGPQLGWGWLIGGWVLLASAPGRSLLVLAARRLLLTDLAPGRYPRRSWLACRLWFVEALSDACRLEQLAGTPWAARYARLLGHDVAPDARLGTLPPATGLVSVGAGATLESELDLHGWWLEGDELIVGTVRIGPGARIGNRSLLMPGAEIGAGAEIEPATVIDGVVPARQRWSGSPGRHVGGAGEQWPQTPAPRAAHPRLIRGLFAGGLALTSALPLLAALPGIGLLTWLGGALGRPESTALALIALAPLMALAFLVSYALIIAGLVRAVARWITPGWYPDAGVTGWALWFSEGLTSAGRGVLFPLYASLYTRAWLRLLGIPVGRRTEVSTAVGINHLTRFGAMSFAADDVVFAGARARDGWLSLEEVSVGDRSFLGNGALLTAGTAIGDDSLVGLLTLPPPRPAAGTSWFGSPALELPRVADRPDPARTTDPPPRLIAARAVMDVIRILLPASLSVILGALVFWALEALMAGAGVAVALGLAPLVLFAAGVAAALLTVLVKWTVIGRYRVGEHPLWSHFVWRDEIVNSCQEQLAGAWLLSLALGTPLVGLYLRLMGASVGADVWCQTLAITEFDLVCLQDGAVVNRNAVIETHLFHDRLMRIGPARIGAGATLGPASATLPETELGAGCSVGGRSVVMRGEHLPPHSCWAGAPVTAV